MMTDFPEFIEITASSYQENHRSNVVRSDFDSGWAKQRNEYFSTFKEMQFSFRFAGHRYDDFMQFYFDIGNGALWFWFWDPQTETKRRVRMVEHSLQLRPQDNQMRSWIGSMTLEVFNAKTFQ